MGRCAYKSNSCLCGLPSHDEGSQSSKGRRKTSASPTTVFVMKKSFMIHVCWAREEDDDDNNGSDDAEGDDMTVILS